MANYYYEISNAVVDRYWYGNRYYVVHNREGDAMMAGGVTITMHSNRIWREENGQVRYIKHRYYGDLTNAQVDMKEFAWVKLSSKVYKR